MSIETSHFQSQQERETTGFKAVEHLGAKALRSANVQLQATAEHSYMDAMTIEPAPSDKQINPLEQIMRLETDHVVKLAPSLQEQVHDAERDQIITYTGGKREVMSLTEHQALQELDEFLAAGESFTSASPIGERIRSRSRDVRDNLTFIGEKEYDEAVTGIANYWKAQLTINPNLQLYAMTGRIDSDTGGLGGGATKSDTYMLDNILKKFSDDELVAWADRLITRDDDISVDDPKNLKVVLLDDWTISGSQLIQAAESFTNDYPEYADNIEVQLIAATEYRLAHGLSELEYQGSIDAEGYGETLNGRISLPIRSYYMAHESSLAEDSGARITGAHSSVDYDFQDTLFNIKNSVIQLNPDMLSDDDRSARDTLTTLPLIQSIERPYRKPGNKMIQSRRLIDIRQNSWS